VGKKLIITLHLFILMGFLWGKIDSKATRTSSLKIHAIHPKKLQMLPKSSPSASPVPKGGSSKKPVAKPAAKPPQKSPTPNPSQPTPKKKLSSQPIKKLEETSSPKLKETIAKIEEKIDKLERQLQGEPKHSDHVVLNPTEIAFDEPIAYTPSGIIEYLFELLELPENGKVLVELKLNPKGSITEVQVLESESEKNRTYLLEALKGLSLPFESKEKIPSSLKVCFSNLNA